MEKKVFKLDFCGRKLIIDIHMNLLKIMNILH